MSILKEFYYRFYTWFYRIVFRFKSWIYGPPKHRDIALVVPNLDAVVGFVSWTILETQTQQVIGDGNRMIRARDYKIVETYGRGKSFFSKSIELEKDFVLHISEHPEPAEERHKGFGLVVGRRGLRTFCWEWFVQSDEGRATKLQETGELEIRDARSPSGWEITETTFLTDADMRVYEFGQSVEAEPRWRVTIHKDSTLHWPLSTGAWPEEQGR